MKPLSAALVFAFPIFAQQISLPGDSTLQQLNHPPNAPSQFLSNNAGWQHVSSHANGLLFQDPKSGKQAAVLGNMTHQDTATGAWTPNDAALSSTANGWRLDGTAYSVFVRQSGAGQHVVTQTYTDYATKHASTLSMTLPKLTYQKGFTFGFNQDGLAWRLILSSQGLFQVRANVSKRIGKVTHSFAVTSSENLTIDSLGNLLGDTYVGLTRALMIPRFGRPIPCSAWSYAKGVASFTCDDSTLKDNQLPYTIDPQSQVTLTDTGTYNIDSWDSGTDGGFDDAHVSFDTSAWVPGPSTIQWTGCSFNVLDSGGDTGNNVFCYLPSAYTAGGVAQVTVGVGTSVDESAGFQPYSVWATVDGVQFWVYFTPPPPAAAPTFSAPGGIYGAAGLGVSLSTSTSGASIRYTTNGTTPSSTAGTLYTGGQISVSSPMTIKAVAYGSQWGTSSVSSATYQLYTPTPIIIPGNGGTYTAPTDISIQLTSPGWGCGCLAYIAVTTDGSTPSYTNGAQYTSGTAVTVPLNTTMTVKAVAIPAYWLGGYVVGNLTTAVYTVTGTVAAPTFSVAAGTYTTAQTVTLSSSTPGATIRYTTDGTAPTETHGTVGTSVSVPASATIQAIAYKSTWADSPVSSAAYTITGTIATPTMSVTGGNCTAGLGGQVCTGTPSITLSTTSSGATIRYTTDGSAPTETHGTVYSGAFTLSSSTNTQATVYAVKAIGYQNTWADSTVATFTFTITGTPAPPVFLPAGGIYTAPQSVALSSATSGTTIRYTTDGTTPTETHGTIYTSPIAVAGQLTISAIAYEQYWLDSAVTSETYYFSAPTGGTGTGSGPGAGSPQGDSGNGMDPRRVGVRALGSYWGDAGENIDTASGNLSFGNTPLKPFGRGNWSLPFLLAYNSQMWQHDANGGDWLLGQDSGYGMGWKLQMGSLTPVWSGASTIDHYLFTDATGAEYSLSVNTGGVWTSKEGIYVSYDSNSSRLYNTDGSFWVMGCTSAATEQDAGTMYPTLAENSNGNTITIAYAPGQGMGAANTSARLSTITDARGTSYHFTYSLLSPSDDIQHLASVMGPGGESWTLTYTSSGLNSPFAGASYGSTQLLTGLQLSNVGAVQPPSARFAYNGSGEMTQYTTPLGGIISWVYSPNTYSSNVSQREVTSRAVNQGAGGFTNTHTLSHPAPCEPAQGAFHTCTQILDAGAGSKKIYYNAAQGSLVLPSQYQETDNNGTTLLLQKVFTWGQNSAGNAYVSRLDSTLNPGSSSAATTSTVQTIDAYGNLTQQQVYDYGSSTVSRTYNLTYLTDPNYLSRYIRNRMVQVNVTANNATTLLVQNAYDSTAVGTQLPQGFNSFASIPQHDSAYDATVTYRGNTTGTWNLGTRMTYSYDVLGNPYLAQDGDGMTVSMSTDASTAGSLPSTLTPNSNGNLATSMGYSLSFSPVSVTGPNGVSQTQQADLYNRPLWSKSADGLTTNYTYTYTPNTQTATASATTWTLWVWGSGNAFSCGASNCGNTPLNPGSATASQWKRTTFDGFGRAIKVETGHDSTTVSTVDTIYGACGCSPLGKVMKVSYPYGPGETEVWTTYTYDGSGRQLTTTVPDGSVTSTSYGGNSVMTTDPTGNWKLNYNDAFGNLVAVYEPDPATGSASTGPVTSYAYNAANQLIVVTIPRGNITQYRVFTYSGSDLASETTPEGGTVNYTYDYNHHVTSRIDAMNQKTVYSYDLYERLAGVQHFNPQGVDQTGQDANYYYDTPVASDFTQSYTWGRLSAVTFGGGEFAYEYSYDQAGRVVANRMLRGGGYNMDLQAQYTWDDHRHITSITYPSGPVMNLQYDAMSRISTMTENTSGYSELAGWATFGSAGQLLTWGGTRVPGMSANGGSGWTTMNGSRTYNNMLQITSQAAMAQTMWAFPYQQPSGTSASVNVNYIYNTGHNNGRVTQTVDGSEIVNYTYDHLNRLTSAVATNNTWGENYTYDGFGNLTGKTPTAGSAPAFSGSAGSNNQLGQLAPNFDIEQRLTTSGGTTYVYDPWGRRIWRQWYDSQHNITMCEAFFYGVTGKVLDTFACHLQADGSLWYGSEGINTYIAGQMLSEKGVYVATDRLGSVRGDSNGVSMQYYPWGEERTSTADGRTKFAGYYRDMPGQDYAGRRYYSSATGSYWSPEQYTFNQGNPQSWNGFAYVQGDPINFTNPNGGEESSEGGCYEDPFTCGIGGGGGGAYANDNDDDQGGGGIPNSKKGIRGVATAVSRLTDGCAAALGSTAVKATSTLETATIKDAALAFSIKFTPTPDGGAVYSVDYLAGKTPGDGSIQLNDNPALSDPSSVYVGTSPDGRKVFANLLEGMETDYGLKAGSLNADLFWAIYELHELGHVLTGLKSDTDNKPLSMANTQTVIDNCFKDLKK
jgi:RHS repeat-associated protein